MTLTLGYAITGLLDLISKSDPKINQNVVHSYYGTEEVGVDLSKTNQRIAIAVQGWDGQLKTDPKYVRLVAEHVNETENGKVYQDLRFHKCTEEDWAHFYPPDIMGAEKLKSLENQHETNARDVFQCLDWDTDLMIRPNYAANLVITLTSCDEIIWYGEEVDDECVADEEEQKAYLDPHGYNIYDTYIIYNYEIFDARNYNEKAILK